MAEAAGLSVSAVSYALRGLQTSTETQARVRAVAAELGYRVDPIARALASGRTGMIGVVVGSLEDLWMQRVAAGISRSLLERGRFALLVDAGADPERERELVHRLVDQRVDALVVSPVHPTAPHWAEVAGRLPVVTVGDSLPGAAVAGEVLFANRPGVTAVLEHLAAAGHRRVALLTTGRPSTPDRPAEQHAVAESERLGLALEVISAAPDVEQAADALAPVLARGRRPTAAFGLSDSLAHGCYLAAQRLGWRIPDDLSVVGFDDHPVSGILVPPLTTVTWNERLLADGVGDAVAAATAPEGAEAERAFRLLLTPGLLQRGSVSPPS
ncbi:MAG TPA: LacI family DNA-binding transcriptional regulator [Acidimicrobiales bacterium]|nr:LacI family DNA-binding transcriptional regulator [Acidimicrobiales bacterium]